VFLVKEVTVEDKDLPKQPQTMIPTKTQTEYNSSGLPASM
jgi:hypothetical protein